MKARLTRLALSQSARPCEQEMCAAVSRGRARKPVRTQLHWRARCSKMWAPRAGEIGDHANRPAARRQSPRPARSQLPMATQQHDGKKCIKSNRVLPHSRLKVLMLAGWILPSCRRSLAFVERLDVFVAAFRVTAEAAAKLHFVA